MGMQEIKRQNMQLIFDSIIDGNNTLTSISKNTGISKMTVCELTQLLIKNKIILKHTEPENKRGRRSNIYTPNNKSHCMYIEETEMNFSCISINTEGNVVQRLVYEKRRDTKLKNVVYDMFVELRRKRAFGRYCACIFAICDDESLEYFPKNTVKTTKEELILSGISDKRKIFLFEIENKQIISAYGHLHFPKKDFTTKQLTDIFEFDKILIYNDDIYFGIFDALQMHTINILREKINKI